MKVLVACEESQEVCKAFRELGHEAYSCDIQECSGGHPEWHILGDALEIINGNCAFKTMDGKEHEISHEWDLLIAHPPCTYFSRAGMANFSKNRTEEYRKERYRKLLESYEFFKKFENSNAKKIAIENPVGWLNTHHRKPDFIINPWQFGHEVNKPTCFWTKKLPPLKPTKIVGRGEIIRKPNGKTISVWFKNSSQKERSKTFPGIARAMAEQWGGDTH